SDSPPTMQCEKRRRNPQSIGTFFVRIRAGLSCGSCFVSRRGNRDGRGRRNPLLQLDDLELGLLLLPADCRGLRLLLLCFARFHEETSLLERNRLGTTYALNGAVAGTESERFRESPSVLALRPGARGRGPSH